MTLSLKAILTLSTTILLAAAVTAPSDARPYARWQKPPQSEPYNYDPDYNAARDWDNSCFRSTGRPAQYACSSHGG